MIAWILAAALAAGPGDAAATAVTLDAPPAADALAAAATRTRPPVQEPTVRALPTPEVVALTPAATLRFVRVPGARHVEIGVQLHRGLDDVSASPEAAYAAFWLADVATEETDADALAATLTAASLDLWTSIDLDEAWVRASGPKGSLGVALDTLRQVLRAPAWPGAELKRYQREEALDLQRIAPTDPRRVASDALRFAWYGPDHPAGRRPDLDALRRLSRKQMVAAHAELLATSPITVHVVGDVALSDVQPALAALVEGLGAPGAPARTAAPTLPAAGAPRVIAVDMPGQGQARLSLRLPGPALTDPATDAYATLAFALGGTFLSRLNANLREDKGFTYGIYGRVGQVPTWGTWTAGVEVLPTNVGAAMDEIDAELARMAEGGLTAVEILSAWRDATTSWNDTMGTAGDAWGAYQRFQERGLTPEAAAAALESRRALTPADTVSLAARWFGADAPRLWVVVGDRAAIAPQLEARGLQAVWIRPEDAVLGALDATEAP